MLTKVKKKKKVPTCCIVLCDFDSEHQNSKCGANLYNILKTYTLNVQYHVQIYLLKFQCYQLLSMLKFNAIFKVLEICMMNHNLNNHVLLKNGVRG